MTGKALQDIRRKLCGTNATAFGRLLGYQGKDASINVSVRRLETMPEIPEWFAKLARLYERQGPIEL